MNLASIAAQARKDEQELGATIENMNWCDTSDIDFDRIKRVHEAMGRTASALEALASGPGQANDQHIGDPDGEAFRTAVRLGMEVKVNLKYQHSTARSGDYVRTEDHVGGAAAGTRAAIRLVDAEFKRREKSA